MGKLFFRFIDGGTIEVNAYFDEIGIRNKEDVCDLVIMLCGANKLSVIEL